MTIVRMREAFAQVNWRRSLVTGTITAVVGFVLAVAGLGLWGFIVAIVIGTLVFPDKMPDPD